MSSRSHRALNSTRATTLAEEVTLADGFFSRLVGLLGHARLGPGEGLHLDPCNSVHTLFMRFPIDVVFLDADGVVLRIVPAMKPWRATAPCRGARTVLELAAGATTGTLAVGDRVAFERH